MKEETLEDMETTIEQLHELYDEGTSYEATMEYYEEARMNGEWTHNDFNGALSEHLIDETVVGLDVDGFEQIVEVETDYFKGRLPLSIDRGELWFAPEHEGDWMHKPTDFEFESPFVADGSAIRKIEKRLKTLNKERGSKPAGHHHWANSRGV